jgi:hypothetical protein
MALRRRIEIEINWVGRIGVVFVFAGLFWSMVIDSWVVTAVFALGVALSIGASVLYVRTARGMQAHSQTLNL